MWIDVSALAGQELAIGLSPLEIGRMSLAEFLTAGREYARIMDPSGAPAVAPPSDDAFDEMLAKARESGFLEG